VKRAFIGECQKCFIKDEKYSHSLTYFLFLSLKLGIFEEDLFRYTVNQVNVNSIPMELESAVLLLFTFTRIERLIGAKKMEEMLQS
jgi:hypothetical protein